MRPANKVLRQLALDLISIPAMSAEVERVFSQAKRLITTDRNRMNDETIEVLQLLKNWWNEFTGNKIKELQRPPGLPN
jgi:hypothetical protein